MLSYVYYSRQAMQAARLFLIRGWEWYQKNKYEEAIDWAKRSLTICEKNENREGIATCCMLLGMCYRELEKSYEAGDNYKRSLGIFIEQNNYECIGVCYEGLGVCYAKLKNYSEAILKWEEGLSTTVKHNLGKQSELMFCYKIALALLKNSRYQDGKQYLDKALIIAKQVGNRISELQCYNRLSRVTRTLCEFDSAMDYANLAMSIASEIDSTEDQYSEKLYAYGIMGNALLHVGRVEEAMKYTKLYLKYAKEIGDRNQEIGALCILSTCYYNIPNYDSAISFAEESLTLAKKMGNIKKAYEAFKIIGCALKDRGHVKEAIEYHNKYLKHAIELNDKVGQAEANNNLGCAYMDLCKHYKAIEYFQTSLKLLSELGIERINRMLYNNLGVLYVSIGNYQQASKYFKLSLSKETSGEISAYYNLSLEYFNFDNLEIAREYSLIGIINGIRTEGIVGKLRYFQKLGNSFHNNRQYFIKARFYHNKAVQLAQEIQNSKLIGECYMLLAHTCAVFGKIDEAIGYNEIAVTTFDDSGDVNNKAECLYRIAHLYKSSIKQNTINNFTQISEKYFREALQYYEEIFADLREKHDLKITIVDTYAKAYKDLALLLIETGRLSEALLVCDRGRACTLRDTLISRYDMQYNQLLVDDINGSKPLEEEDVEDLLSSERSLLFLAMLKEDVHSWILSQTSSWKYVQNESNGNNVLPNVAEIIDYIITQPTPDKSLQSDLTKLLKKLFQHLITSIKEYLIEDEVVIVPEHNLYMVPFAALQDPQTGRYFCESKRIRIMPSLTTMKILQQCPPDYHCSEDALVVGNPSVDEVIFRGERKIFPSLKEAEREACVFASILGVKPLTGTSATKDAVKEKLKEGAEVIHIAAHGDDTTGEIILAPGVSAQTKAIPEEEDYILTMQEVQDIGVRAKLVVLSCCHTGRGEIRSEGVIGMARAFLAAGARAVVASLWTISDKATLDFMSGFYYHLRIGESASKSLNESMKELIREKKYSHPKYWAPFVLIGDDVTIF